MAKPPEISSTDLRKMKQMGSSPLGRLFFSIFKDEVIEAFAKRGYIKNLPPEQAPGKKGGGNGNPAL